MAGAVGAAVTGLTLLVLTFVAIPGGSSNTPLVVAAFPVLFTVISLVVAFATPRATRREAAIIADCVLATHSLLTTALELTVKPNDAASSDSERAVLQAATDRANVTADRAVVPIRWTRPAMIGLVLAVSTVAVPLLPFAIDKESLDRGARLSAAAAALEGIEIRVKRAPDDDEPVNIATLRRDSARLRDQMKGSELDPREAACAPKDSSATRPPPEVATAPERLHER
jgi:hypothetical protein